MIEYPEVSALTSGLEYKASQLTRPAVLYSLQVAGGVARRRRTS